MTVAYVHILVIDDDEKQSDRMTRPFGAWGWATERISSDPEAALARLREESFDLVLLHLKAAERGHYAFLRERVRAPRLRDIPVVITAWPDAQLSRLARCIEKGATDYITHPEHYVLMRARLQNILQRWLMQEQANTALEAFNEIEKIADDLRLVILPIGAALSVEEDFDRLIARIVAEAQNICNADAGALYLAGDEGLLRPQYARIDSIDYTYPNGDEETAESIAPIPVSHKETGEPNNDSLLVYVALTGESINMTDVNRSHFDLGRLTELASSIGFEVQTALAVPLRNGQIIGTLLLGNCRDPLSGAIVPFDAYHQQVAESLASQAAVVLNNRVLNERHSQLMRFKRELEIGRQIQLSFLPARLPNPPGWDVAALFRPALEVAGDFYDAFLLPHGYLAVVIADVVGKGVMAALFMAIIRSLYRALFQQNYVISETPAAPPDVGLTAPFPFVDRGALLRAVQLTNAYLITNHSDTYAFATLFAGVLDPGSGRLIYVNAGHNPPLILAPEDGGRAIRAELSPTGPAIGLLLAAEYHLGETTLNPGDLFFAYTDGVIDARDPAAEEFGLERLKGLLTAGAGSAGETLAAIDAALHAHTAVAEAFDDVTMLALRRLQAN